MERERLAGRAIGTDDHHGSDRGEERRRNRTEGGCACGDDVWLRGTSVASIACACRNRAFRHGGERREEGKKGEGKKRPTNESVYMCRN